MAGEEAKGTKGTEERKATGGAWGTQVEPLLLQLQAEAEPLQRMFEKFINRMLSFKKDNCNELVPVPEYSGIVSLCKLYSALATPENGVRGHQGRKDSGPPGATSGNQRV